MCESNAHLGGYNSLPGLDSTANVQQSAEVRRGH